MFSLTSWRAVDLASAEARPTHPYTKAELKLDCELLGGTYQEIPGTNAYYCVQTDGTVIFCGGGRPTACQVFEARQRGIDALISTVIATQGTILDQQQKLLVDLSGIRVDLSNMVLKMEDLHTACAPPDLVPVPVEGSINPDFCRTDGTNGNLLVKVKNQGFSDAAPSTLRVTFSTPGGPLTFDVPTPQLNWGGGVVDLPVAIPPECYGPADPFLHPCNFQIFVDVGGVVVESSEPNNNVVGVCLPVF